MGRHSAHLIGFLFLGVIGMASSLASQDFDGPRASLNQPFLESSRLQATGRGGRGTFSNLGWLSGFLVCWYGQLPGLPRL